MTRNEMTREIKRFQEITKNLEWHVSQLHGYSRKHRERFDLLLKHFGYKIISVEAHQKVVKKEESDDTTNED